MKYITEETPEHEVIDIINNGQSEFKLSALRRIKIGSENYVFDADGKYIIKFPREWRGQAGIEAEFLVTPMLKELGVMYVPEVKLSKCDYSFVFYRKIQGTIIKERHYPHYTQKEKINLARDVACFMKSLHSIDKDIFLRKNINFSTSNQSSPEKLAKIQLMPEDNKIKELAKQYSERLGSLINDVEVFSHFDLHGENIIVDRTSAEIKGIIDYSNCNIFNINKDFAALFFLAYDYGISVIKEYQLISKLKIDLKAIDTFYVSYLLRMTVDDYNKDIQAEYINPKRRLLEWMQGEIFKQVGAGLLYASHSVSNSEFITKDTAHDNVIQIINSGQSEFIAKNIKSLSSTEGFVFNVNDEYIVKFPSEKRGKKGLITEHKILKFLQHKVSLPIPRMNISSGETFFAWYVMAEGNPLTCQVYEKMSDQFKDSICNKIARFMYELHSIPIEEIKNIEIDFSVTNSIKPQKIIHWLKPASEKINLIAYKYLDEFEKIKVKHNVFSHFDLHGDNVIVNPATGAINAVIDFSNCNISDVNRDLQATILTSHDYYQRILNHYRNISKYYVDEKIINTYAICYCMKGICFSYYKNDKQGIVRWEGRLWSWMNSEYFKRSCPKYFLYLSELSDMPADSGNIGKIINDNGLVREKGNGGVTIPEMYRLNQAEVRQYLALEIAYGRMFCDLAGYKKVIQQAHKIACSGKCGTHIWYSEHGKGKIKLEPGAIRTGSRYKAARKDKALLAEKIAKQYSDPFTLDMQSKVDLANITDEIKPTNDGATHYYPKGGELLDPYFEQMRCTGKDVMDMISINYNQMEILNKIAEHYQYAVNARPFGQINNSLFMNETNLYLKLLDLDEVPHGDLDHIAQRLQPAAFKRYFYDYVMNYNK